MASDSPADLTDADLAHRCRRRVWEGVVRVLVIVLPCVAGVALAVAGVTRGIVSGCVVVPGLPLTILAGMLALQSLREALPLAADRRELAFRRFRSGVAPWAPGDRLQAWSRRLLDEARITRHAFRDVEDPEWLVVLQGTALPGGERVHVRALLGREGSRSSVLVHRGGLIAPELLEGASPVALPLPLSAGEAGDLLALLATFPDGFRAPPRGDFVKDGFPCDLVVARREPGAGTLLSWNLAGTGAEEQAPPVAVARALLAIARRADGDAMLVGAVGARGDISLGRV